MNWIFSKNAESAIQNNIETFAESYSQSISTALDSYIEELDRISKIILGNQQIQEALRRRNSSNYSNLQILQDNEMMQSVIFSFTALRDSTQIVLADQDGNVVLKPLNAYQGTRENLFVDKFILEHKSQLNKGDFLLVPSCYTTYKNYSGKPVFLLIRALRNLQSETEAYIAILFSERILDTLLKEYQDNISGVEIDILDSTGTVVAGLDGQTGETFKDLDNRYHKTVCHSEITGWDTVVRIPNEYLYQSFQERNWMIVPMFLIIALGSLLLGVYLYFSVIQPVNRLNRAMKQVEKGDWELRLKESQFSRTMQTLYHGFNSLIAEIGHLTERIMREKILFKDAQMAALRYQINPHFLYNSLQTIEAIAEVRDVPEIQMISRSMGEMFRYNIRGFETVQLWEEIKMIEAYLKIEQIRFGDTFQWVLEIGETEGRCEILKFILQPIVENCIVHGLKDEKENIVKIRSEIKNGTLILEVFNSGRPIEEERLRQLRENLYKSRQETDISWVSESIGVMNVHKRLINRFGKEYGVEIVYSDSRGTCIRLSMPEKYGRNYEKRIGS